MDTFTLNSEIHPTEANAIPRCEWAFSLILRGISHSVFMLKYLLNFLAGYEIIGLERIPNSGPALMIYYHGAIPIDFYYIMAKVILYKSRMIRAVGDRFLFKTPGMKEVQYLLTQKCVDVLLG